MPKPTLDERFTDGPPLRGPEDRHRWLDAEERRFILWASKESWSAIRIGRALGVNEATVRRFRRGYWEDPRLLLELGLFEMVGKAGEEEFRCLVCADRVAGRSQIQRHVVSHYVDEEVAGSLLTGTPDDRNKPAQGIEQRRDDRFQSPDDPPRAARKRHRSRRRASR